MGWPKGVPQSVDSCLKRSLAQRGQPRPKLLPLRESLYGKAAHRFNKYKGGLEAIRKLLIQQGNVCAIRGCSSLAEHVDHDHISEEIRGLLCRRHNLAVGYLNDDPEEAVAVQEYLESTKQSLADVIAKATT